MRRADARSSRKEVYGGFRGNVAAVTDNMERVHYRVTSRARRSLWYLKLVGALVTLLSVPVLADTYVRDDIITEPTPEAFSICFNHTCKEVKDLTLQGRQWQEILAIFSPPVADAAEERRRIAEAVARLELVVGELADTSNDKGGNLAGMFSDGHQMDCIDESTNTTTYLMMLSEGGVLRWHSVGDRATRGFFIFGMPHTTAVLKDRLTGAKWAVDSWFHDNGVAPEIVPLGQWRAGWEPVSRLSTGPAQ